MSCLVADQIFFNSKFNMESFLTEIDKSMKSLFPADQLVPMGTTPEKIRSKSQVLYFPIPMETFQISTEINKTGFPRNFLEISDVRPNSHCVEPSLGI